MRLRDGRQICVRPARTNDRGAMQASSHYLSPASGLAEVAHMVDPEWQGTGLGGLFS